MNLLARIAARILAKRRKPRLTHREKVKATARQMCADMGREVPRALQ